MTDIVWKRIGNVANYIEPFAGSAAMLLGRPHQITTQKETLNDKDCVAPETRLLGFDLRWVSAGSVYVGQELLGFDEENGGKRVGFGAPGRYRHWKKATVWAVEKIIKPCYRLTFDDGTVVTASADHLWLGGSHTSGGGRGGRAWRWQKTESLVCNRKTQRSWILKVCRVTEQDKSYESGWLSGFFDGEGHFRNAPGWRIGATQKLGIEADLVESHLKARGFSVACVVHQRKAINEKHHNIATFEINGGMRETLRFMMLARPERLIRKFQNAVESMSLYGWDHQAVGLVSKEFVGNQEVMAIQTDCHTFIAEGLASHNCYIANFWRSIEYAPEETAYHASQPVNEACMHAWHNHLVNSEYCRDLRKRLRTDPMAFDPQIAGRWCWGLCMWIGGRWAAVNDDSEEFVETRQKMPSASSDLGGVLSQTKPLIQQIPCVDPTGVYAGGRPQLADAYSRGRGVHGNDSAGMCADRLAWITEWFAALRDRLRVVRVCCGDWLRVCDSPSVTTRLGVTGIFADPPYGDAADRDMSLYSEDCGKVAADVRAYCLERGNDPMYRICLAGYAGEGHEALEAAGWDVVAWRNQGGYGNRTQKGKSNAGKERLWFSPHCDKQAGLFDELE